jgi:AcrR family transcriptional regulator
MNRNDDVDVTVVLDAARTLLLTRGHATVTVPAIATLSNIPQKQLREVFSTANDALVAMLNREYRAMYVAIIPNIERDPRGGLLSQICRYMLTEVYENPVAKTLFMTDPEALSSLMRNAYSFSYLPGNDRHLDLAERLQHAGMIRADVNAATVASIISAFSGGLALTAPHHDLDTAVDGLALLLARGVDADIDNDIINNDTSAGKAVFYDWAARLTDMSASRT